MAKLIIYVSGKPLVNGYKRREFLWSVEHSCYIYKGRELDEQEFNQIAEKVMRQNDDMHPLIKVSSLTEVGAPSATPGEITVSEAEDVLMRLAPHRLKGKTGPRPGNRALEEVME